MGSRATSYTAEPDDSFSFLWRLSVESVRAARGSCRSRSDSDGASCLRFAEDEPRAVLRARIHKYVKLGFSKSEMFFHVRVCAVYMCSMLCFTREAF